MLSRVLSACLVSVLLIPSISHAEWFWYSGTAMTTRIELQLWSDDQATADSASEAVFAEFDRINQRMTRYSEDSELSLVNREAGERPVEVSDSLFRVIEEAQRVSKLSNGAFDISFGSVGFLYDYRELKQPTDTEVAERLQHVSFRDIVLDAEKQTVAFRKPRMKLDLGGIAKGYAVDRGIGILKARGIHHARLSAGGDMRLLGDKRGSPWVVGVRDPRSEDSNAVVLPVSDLALSTSGDYERFFIDEAGNRIHHILSPETGRPAKGIQSVTVMGPDALTTDGLSTAVFVLGVEKGLAMINGLNGIDAIIIDENRDMHYSQGLAAPEAVDSTP
ncbi:FAD:protein FMN transferase [Marinobacter sp.]|uniref:FAD:protein FMN transferase n=1 Tax=Marinobacter sp. TaxID=50741 RepID=UPI00384D80C7